MLLKLPDSETDKAEKIKIKLCSFSLSADKTNRVNKNETREIKTELNVLFKTTNKAIITDYQNYRNDNYNRRKSGKAPKAPTNS